jgi:hypothetical protein
MCIDWPRGISRSRSGPYADGTDLVGYAPPTCFLRRAYASGSSRSAALPLGAGHPVGQQKTCFKRRLFNTERQDNRVSATAWVVPMQNSDQNE